MSELENLPLVRVDVEYQRLKKPGFGTTTNRNFSQHANILNQEIISLVESHKNQRPEGIKPELILKIQYSNNIQPDELRRSGLQIIGESTNKALILFSSDGEMNEFRRRVQAYSAGPQESKNPAYNNLVANIDSISVLTSLDRTGPKLQMLSIQDEIKYWVDIELWHLGDVTTCREKVREITEFISKNGGRVTDDYVGNTLCVLRANIDGVLIKQLLEFEIIRQIELPPRPSFNVREIPSLEVGDFQPVESPPPGSVGICIIDSGIATGHPFLGPAVGDSASFPEKIGSSEDVQGHGTKVAGIALYGDVLKSIHERRFTPLSHLYSARVTNEPEFRK